MDMGLAHEWHEGTIAALKKALDEGLDQYETAARMIALLGPEPHRHAASVVRALQYHPAPRPHLKDPGSRIYAPMFEIGGSCHPEPVGEATEETLSAWADALDLLAAYPLVVARLADLLWLRRFGAKPYVYAQAAQQALRALWAYPSIAEVYRADCLTRALDITAEAGMKEHAVETVGELVSAAKQVLANPEPMPGPSLRLLTRLAALPAKQRPVEMADLLGVAGTAFSADPFSLDAVMQLRLQLAGADPEARRTVATDIVELWEAAAEDAAAPLVAIRHLEQALAVARSVGLREDTQRLLVRLQEISRGDQGLVEFSAEVSVPSEHVEAFIGQFLAGDDPRAWLTRFGSYCPVQDDRDAVAEQVRAAMRESPFYYLATLVKLNVQGLPVKILSGDDARFAQAVIDHDTHGITSWGVFAADILGRIVADSRTTPEAIAGFLTEGIFDELLSDGLVRAFGHFAAGRYEEALLCAVPRLETALRSASMELGLVVYTEPAAARNGLGTFVGLGELLVGLKGRTPDAERTYLTLLLSDPLSLNLRNRALHGLMQQVSKQDAALVLHAAATLALWHRTTINEGGASQAES
jgi:hypothetical protein